MELLDIFTHWLIPFICTIFFTYILKCIKNFRNTDDAIKNALLSIIRSKIVSMCEEYQSLGYLPEYARYTLDDLHKQYVILGGNHGIEKLVHNTFDLPTSLKNKGGK